MVRELIIDPELEQCLNKDCPMSEKTYQQIRASIEKKYDPAKPIVLWKERPNTIVDGHHRYKICQELGVEPVTIEESFASMNEAKHYSLKRALDQRQLTADQEVMVTLKVISLEEIMSMEEIAKENQGKRTDLDNIGLPGRPKSERFRNQIAERAGVGHATVSRFQEVKEKAIPEIIEKIGSGEFSSRAGSVFIKAVPDKEKQREILKSGGMDAVREIARSQRKEEEARRNAQKEAEAKQIEALRNTKRAISNDVKEFNEYVKDTFGEAKNVCFRGAKVELWCSDCAWGFDVYNPNEAKTCPYCSGSNINRREPDWWPGKKAI